MLFFIWIQFCMKAFRTFDNEKVYVFHIYLHIPYNSWWTTTWNIKQHQQKMTIMRKILFLFCLDYLRLELLVILIKDESGSSFSTKFWFFYARYARYWTQHNIYQLALIILKPSKQVLVKPEMYMLFRFNAGPLSCRAKFFYKDYAFLYKKIMFGARISVKCAHFNMNCGYLNWIEMNFF